MSAISLTESAKSHIQKVLTDMDKPYLVFGLKGGGCAGFEYFWVPVTEEEYAEHGEPDKDIFIELENNKKMIVDNAGLDYLIGSRVDYKTDFVSSQLVVDNPNATGGCGCGTSVAF